VTTTKLGEIDVSVDMESELLIAKIAEFLHEPKVELIGKCFYIYTVNIYKCMRM
jgi:hypothetical protein